MTPDATVAFHDASGLECAVVHLFHESDPEADLREFLRRVAKASWYGGAHEARFDDARVLAARYVAWKTGGGITSVKVGLGMPQQDAKRHFSVYAHALPSMTIPHVQEW
jgi:hypothetical protein